MPKRLPGKLPVSLLIINFLLALTLASQVQARPTAVDGPLAGLLTSDFTGCGGSLVPAENADFEQQVVELTNQERAKYGLPPLKRTDQLDEAARYHAADMLQDRYVDHDTYDRVRDSLVWMCFWSSRLASYYSGSDYSGENVAWNYPDPQAVVRAWMGSAGHRENILNRNYREIGAGYAHAYWVQDFGSRTDVYPLVINGEAEDTDTRQVSLYVYGKGAWTEMRLRNDSGEWGYWQPFQERLNWTLAPGKGLHTVSVELRSGFQMTTSDDFIYLTQGAMLGNLPDRVTFLYSKADQRLLPASMTLTPLNIGDEQAIDWQATGADGWYVVNEASGSTPSSSFTVTPTDVGSTRSGQVTVTASQPPETAGSPHSIMIGLLVFQNPFAFSYLPLTLR